MSHENVLALTKPQLLPQDGDQCAESEFTSESFARKFFGSNLLIGVEEWEAELGSNERQALTRLPWSASLLQSRVPWDTTGRKVWQTHELMLCPWSLSPSILRWRKNRPDLFFDYKKVLTGRISSGFIGGIFKNVESCLGQFDLELSYDIDMGMSWYQRCAFASQPTTSEWIAMSEMLSLPPGLLSIEEFIPEGWCLPSTSDLVFRELLWLVTHDFVGQYDFPNCRSGDSREPWLAWSSDVTDDGCRVVVGTIDGKIWIDSCPPPTLLDVARGQLFHDGPDMSIGVRLSLAPTNEVQLASFDKYPGMGLVRAKFK